MNYRFIVQQLINVHKQDLKLLPRFLTTDSSPQLTAKTRQWAIKRYVLLFGLPITTYIAYRLSTKYETRRKHGIVLGSMGRATR